MPQRKTHQLLLNGLGSAGYAFCLLQWFWLVILYLEVILPLIQPFITEGHTAPTPVTPTPQTEPSLLLLFVVSAIATTVVTLSVVALARIPRAVANGGKRITHAPAEFIVPSVAARHHLKTTEKRRLSRRIIFGAKLLICSIPAIVPFAVPSGSLPWPVVATVTTFLFTLSFSLFCLQALFSKLVGVSYETST